MIYSNKLERFFENEEELQDWCEFELANISELELVKCKKYILSDHLNLAHIVIDDFTSKFIAEDWEPDLSALTELQNFFQDWCLTHDMVWYEPTTEKYK